MKETWKEGEMLTEFTAFSSGQTCGGLRDKALPHVERFVHSQTQSVFEEIIIATQAICHQKLCFETPRTYRRVNNSSILGDKK